MAIGLVFGRKSPEEETELCYRKTQQFIDTFQKYFGSINCHELTGCDLGTTEGHKKFEEDNIIEKCATFTAEAAKMTLEIINASPSKEIV